DFKELLMKAHPRALLLESKSVLTPGEKVFTEAFENGGGHIISAEKPSWMNDLKKAIGQQSVVVTGPSSVRAVVHDQPNRTIVHVYNLNIVRQSSFEDKIEPARGVNLKVRVPFTDVGEISVRSADESGTSKYQTSQDGDG